VMRPVREAADVSITTRPRHRLRSLAYPHLVGVLDEEDAPVERSRTIDYKPPKTRTPSIIDVYREAHGQKDLFELIDMRTALDLIREEKRARAAARRSRWLRRIVVMLISLSLVTALTVAALILMSRSGRPVPDWVPFMSRLDMGDGDAAIEPSKDVREDGTTDVFDRHDDRVS
jgi:hypothetical protein